MPLELSHIDEAFDVLDSTHGKPQSAAERKRLSIDLAQHIFREAAHSTTAHEKSMREQFSRLMADPAGKAFTAAMTDECFRSKDPKRVADQIIYLLHRFGLPQYLCWFKRLQLHGLKIFGPLWARYIVPVAASTLRNEANQFILQGEPVILSMQIEERKSQGIRLDLARIGETVLSEPEAQKWLKRCLEDLENPNIESISVKISSLCSRIHLIDYQNTLETIAERLRILYRHAIKHPFTYDDGEKQSRCVILDMEDYEKFYPAVDVFRKVLEEPEFHHYSAGITLQAYLPDSFHIQKELTEWAKIRLQNGGAPIFIRIVKGAYLAIEQVVASHNNWPQAPCTTKLETDANFKRMLTYGAILENARAARLNVGTHNIFDIAYAMLLRSENQVEPYIFFEMMEGVAEPIRRVVQKLTGDILLYAPVSAKDEFLQTIAYIFRRLNENSGPENFLRHIFSLKPGTDVWENQTALFCDSCDEMATITQPRRAQNRLLHPQQQDLDAPFDNEPDTDFSLPQNRKWATEIAAIWKEAPIQPVPLGIAGKEIFDNEDGVRQDPSNPEKHLFRYAMAKPEYIEQALACAQKHEEEWAATSIQHRSHLLAKVAHKLRERRSELIGAMMIDGGKIVSEADHEVSRAIDYAEYYRRQILRLHQMKDIRWEPKGTILVVSPWNFPCSVLTGGALSALVTGNCVLLKPASNAVLVAWNVVNAMWDAGIPREILQIIPCSRELANDRLIVDPRIKTVIFTGSTASAQQFLQTRPGLDLAGETSGKNSIIVTAMSDRHLAIQELIRSAFDHNGQKCSSASLAILEAEVYDDPSFRQELKDAAASLKVGPAWDLSSQISPLILAPGDALKRSLTTLEEKEEWLLEPKQDALNPHLWSPGIKLGVQPGSFTHQTELFGPLLGLMRAESLAHAVELANATSYGLTAGLISLDEREHDYWIKNIEAGNCFINYFVTGSSVRRQPFGGMKSSSFGNGSKTGGPNYLREFMKATQTGLPQEKHPVNESVNNLTAFLNKINLSAEQLGIWYASIANYAYWWKRLKQNRDPNKIIGQDNFFHYVPRQNMALRIESDASCPLDILRVCAAILTIGVNFEVSFPPNLIEKNGLNWLELPNLQVKGETSDLFLDRIRTGKIERIRMIEPITQALKEAAAVKTTHIVDVPVLANGRLELLHYLREVSVCLEYHRYGNLGIREGELRKPIL